MKISVDEMKKRVNDYLHFNGIAFSSKQIEGLFSYLDRFRNDEVEFENEMICEIRTLNGD